MKLADDMENLGIVYRDGDKMMMYSPFKGEHGATLDLELPQIQPLPGYQKIVLGDNEAVVVWLKERGPVTTVQVIASWSWKTHKAVTVVKSIIDDGLRGLTECRAALLKELEQAKLT